MPRVGFWLRLAAALIDVVFLLVIEVALGLAWMFVFMTRDLSTRSFSIVLVLVFIAYTSLEFFIAATPGKLILGQRIAARDSPGAGRWRLFLRWATKQMPLLCQGLFVITGGTVFYYLGGLEWVVVLIGFLFVANDEKLAWHDQWAGTAVVRRRALAGATA